VALFLKKVFNDGCDKYEFRMELGKGEILEVEIAGRIIQGAPRTQQMACLFARNVTERNRMENELIQSERLGIIGKMAAGVAHEINNPLGIIRYNAEDLLFAEELSDEARDGLNAISRNAARAGDTIASLLDLASPKPMVKSVLDLEEIVRDSIALLGPKIKNVTLTLTMKDAPLSICGDSPALHQVMVNLLLNAISSMEDQKEIHISGDRSADGVRLVVADTGKGIRQEDLAQVFEPFFSSRKNGFGLGLFITRRIVERHYGVIFAESQMGKGACFILEFPTCTATEGA
jgi:signal transduction histidine kinase